MKINLRSGVPLIISLNARVNICCAGLSFIKGTQERIDINVNLCVWSLSALLVTYTESRCVTRDGARVRNTTTEN